MCWPLSGGGSGSPSRSGSVCTLPPRVGLASRRVTSWPASTRSSAAARPARPPPTTTAFTWCDASSSRERGSDHAQLGDRRERRRATEHVESVAFDPLEGGAIEARKRRDAGGAPAVQMVEQGQAFGEVRPRTVGLEAHQLPPLRSDETLRDVVLRDAEPREHVLGKIDPAETPIPGDVANDVDQLQGDAQRLGALGLVGSIDRNARAPDRPGDARAVTAQLVEIRVARLFGVLDAAVDQRRKRLPRNRESFPRVGKSDEHRLLARRCFESPPKLLEENALFLVRKGPVRKVVDTPRKRIDGGYGTPLRPRQQHDSVGEITGALPRQALDLGIGSLDDHGTRAPIAVRASRARDGLGRPEKTSKRARSSASTAASPPRAKAVTARPVRPPSLGPSGSPAASRPRARPPSNSSRRRSGSFGRSSSATPKRRRSSAGR